MNQSSSRSRNSPFDGRTFRGGPVATVVGGEAGVAEGLSVIEHAGGR